MPCGYRQFLSDYEPGLHTSHLNKGLCPREMSEFCELYLTGLQNLYPIRWRLRRLSNGVLHVVAKFPSPALSSLQNGADKILIPFSSSWNCLLKSKERAGL